MKKIFTMMKKKKNSHIFLIYKGSAPLDYKGGGRAFLIVASVKDGIISYKSERL